MHILTTRYLSVRLRQFTSSLQSDASTQLKCVFIVIFL